MREREKGKRREKRHFGSVLSNNDMWIYIIICTIYVIDRKDLLSRQYTEQYIFSIKFQIACKEASQLSGVAGTLSAKNPKLYYLHYAGVHFSFTT